MVSCDDSSYESSLAPEDVIIAKNISMVLTNILAKEIIRFERDDYELYSVLTVNFGCAQNVVNKFNVGSGLLGLAYGKFSILK
ncbi:predicted protein [Arabidopsis lyrata subsp. lyrata]|uniref:Predicted protein n=1 Tax=Arabidopsis lyrata subsp. lyrata TaxID=81972 RepID=D7KRU9_ARALL|nr:predicted protein [Arabidopsis lyrata subsp. lyrata]